MMLPEDELNIMVGAVFQNKIVFTEKKINIVKQ